MQDIVAVIVGFAFMLVGLAMIVEGEGTIDAITLGILALLGGLFLATWEARHNVAHVSSDRLLMFPFTANQAIPRDHISAVTIIGSEHHLFRYVVELELDEKYPSSVGRRFHTEVLLRRNAVALAERMAAILRVPVKEADS